MKVSVILQKKGSADIVTVRPGTTISDAVRDLSRRRIGALVVSPDGAGIAGIVSERDIVRRLGEEGPGVLARPVSDIMTTTVETCTAEDTAYDLLDRMTRGRFRHMPVVGPGGRMTGILSIGDVVKARLEEIESENAAMAEMLSS
ncbi:MAG TPA: CBS domain-containing protein [Paracoccaceae bacterium]|nr:CBS domain-containing protein [Paracoccaceae bacterium]